MKTATERRRERYYLRTFNITIIQIELVLDYQNHCCAICKRPLGPRWHLDHSHKTGLVRGILCSQCNRALGKIEDPRWQWTYKEVYNASYYLTNPPAVDAVGTIKGFPGRIGTARYRKWLKNK